MEVSTTNDKDGNDYNMDKLENLRQTHGSAFSDPLCARNAITQSPRDCATSSYKPKGCMVFKPFWSEKVLILAILVSNRVWFLHSRLKLEIFSRSYYLIIIVMDHQQKTFTIKHQHELGN